MSGQTNHPLDPLSSDEFTAVASILRRDRGVGDGWRIASIELVEPGKEQLADYDAGQAEPLRRAVVMCLDRAANATYKGVVSLTDDRVENLDRIPGAQPNFTVDEYEECDRLLRTHPDVIAALAKRGITDLTLVFMDTGT
jgi:primary-amine oxidase